jgi:hypothetical protein
MNLTQLQQWQQAVREARARVSPVSLPADVVLAVAEWIDDLLHADRDDYFDEDDFEDEEDWALALEDEDD